MNQTAHPDSRFAAKIFPSANHGERKPSGNGAGDDAPPRRPDMLILHYTGMSDAGEALQWLCNPVSQVSSHYFVFENGHTLQLVPEERRAWHAGASHWAGETDINSCSIGIEIANPGHPGGLPEFPTEQIAATLNLCRDICERWAIPPERVLAHSDIAPGRKIDPGEKFPWRRLSEGGVGVWAEPAPIRSGRFLARGETGQPVEALQAMFAMLGYAVTVDGVFDEAFEAVVAAFQRHWRPEKVDGVADASTITTLRDLLALTREARTA
jgi:N-acetylmuramoyl-L-alanine amidase